MHYYEIAPTKVIRGDQSSFTYHSPVELATGQIVSIKVGKLLLVGVVIRQAKKPAYATKPVEAILQLPALPPALITTAEWMSEYYATHLALVLQAILPKGLTKKRRSKNHPSPTATRDRTHFVFTKDQQYAVSTLSTMSPGSALLHGVTGSGKTAVYIALAQQAIQQGQSVIILVPEIALTSQLVAEFTHHFQDIILTHSKQTESERHTVWLDALTSTTPRVVIGPRSALFIPAPHVSLVIIDEAHEPSYKQDQSPRYSALRVAALLVRPNNGRVIQGSATPLISEYYLAQQAQRPIVTMEHKAQPDTKTPHITVVDMTKKHEFTEHRLFSTPLLTTLRDTLAAGNQALIFHNRRGSASTTLCEACGWSAMCPRCYVPFTLHADQFSLRCHICGNHQRVPTHCPECQSTDILHKGIGTKLIESELNKLFPGVTIARFDGDTANSETVESRYSDLYSGAIQLIVGTQVIAKGLDLPKLRAVGVVQADAGLSLPDYAASERTFQLLAQVVGRVGRSHHSSTICIQSYQPQAPAVQLGIQQHYSAFYTAAIAERQRALFPPFVYLLKLTCVYKTEAAAIRNAQQLATTLRSTYPTIQILGPTPAFYERQRDTYRWQITIKSPTRAVLTQIAKSVPPHWQFDLDPMTLL